MAVDTRIGLPGAGGGGGFTLGPEQNTFTGADRAAAKSARDTYFTANPSNLAEYDADSSLNILLTYTDSGDSVALYQIRQGGEWRDNSSATGVAGPPGMGTIDPNIPDGTYLMKDTVSGQAVAVSAPAVSAGGVTRLEETLEAESRSVLFGEAITASEATYDIAVTNNVLGGNSVLSRAIVNRDAADGRISINQAQAAEFPFNSQPDDSTQLTDNPFIDTIPIQLTARTNRLTFRTFAPMTNVRIKVSQQGSTAAIKYFPSKTAWLNGEGGYNLRQGDNFIDFVINDQADDPANGEFYAGFSTFQQTAGQNLVTEVQADNVAFLGAPDGRPWLTATVQLTNDREAAFTDELNTLIEAYTGDDRLSYLALKDRPTEVVANSGDLLINTAELYETYANKILLHSGGAANIDVNPSTLFTVGDQITLVHSGTAGRLRFRALDDSTSPIVSIRRGNSATVVYNGGTDWIVVNSFTSDESISDVAVETLSAGNNVMLSRDPMTGVLTISASGGGTIAPSPYIYQRRYAANESCVDLLHIHYP